jgi:hypothetical protein
VTPWRPHPPLRVLLWFGVLGAPAAWATQHVTGFALTQAECGAGFHGQIALDGLTIAVTVAAAAVAVAAELCAIAVFRRTRDAGEEPPGSRVHFMAIIGMTIGPLFLAIILMSGLGVAVLENCRQS